MAQRLEAALRRPAEPVAPPVAPETPPARNSRSEPPVPAPAPAPPQTDPVDHALDLIRQQKHEQAYTELNDIVKKEPANTRATAFLAAMELQTGRLADCQQHVTELTAKDPKNPDLRELSGQLFMARRDWKKAEEEWRWIIGERSLSREGNFQHRSNQRCGNTVSSNVGNENAETIVVHGNEIVKITGDGAHGDIASGDFEARVIGNRFRKNGRLDGARNFEFFVDGKQFLLVGKNAV